MGPRSLRLAKAYKWDKLTTSNCNASGTDPGMGLASRVECGRSGGQKYTMSLTARGIKQAGMFLGVKEASQRHNHPLFRYGNSAGQ